MTSRSATSALAALAQASRLAVFRALVQAGPDGLAAGEIAARTRIAPSALSFHLKELSRARLVHARPEGRFIFYAANFDTMNALIAFLTENCCGGTGCGPACEPARSKTSSKPS